MTLAEDEKLFAKILLLARIWWFGPLSGAAIAVGLTNVVGICLWMLHYLYNLQSFTINLLIIFFSAAVLLMSNVMLMYGALKSRATLLVPWLVTTGLACLAAIIFASLNWEQLSSNQPVIVGALIFSGYFIFVVSSFYHELQWQAVVGEKAGPGEAGEPVMDGGVGTPMVAGVHLVSTTEETVLVNLEQEEEEETGPRLPRPDEVIPVVKLESTNPFLSDVFQINEKKEKGKQQPVSAGNIKANFTPFKKSKKEGVEKTPGKMTVFLPGGPETGEDSDFDFSFTDPDFNSSLCADKHQETE